MHCKLSGAFYAHPCHRPGSVLLPHAVTRDLELDDKRAPVTGSTAGSGYAIARCLAEATAETGITVNRVLPGPTLTAAADRFLRAQAENGGDILDVERQGASV